MELRQNGYYVSDGRQWEDYPAGHKETGFSFKFIKIHIDNTFFSCSKTDKEYEFILHINQFSTIKEFKKNTPINYGKFEVEDNIVKFNFTVLEKYHMQFSLKIINSDLLEDEKGILLRFKETENYKLNIH